MDSKWVLLKNDGILRLEKKPFCVDVFESNTRDPGRYTYDLMEWGDEHIKYGSMILGESYKTLGEAVRAAEKALFWTRLKRAFGVN